MRYRKIVTEDFTNYKVPSMFIGCIDCDGKCCTEGGFSPSVCCNDVWRKTDVFEVSDREIIKAYLKNPITHAFVFGLLEPMLQFEEIIAFIKALRVDYKCYDDVVIYTGYREDELQEEISELAEYGNVVMKFGRYSPGFQKHFDETLGVFLASPNQYAKRL